MFLTLAQIIEEATNKFNIDDLYGLIKEHLENLTVQIQDYSPNKCSKSFSLTINPFNTSVYGVIEAPLEFVFQEHSYSSLHSGRSLAWDHVRGNIDDPGGGITDFCRVIANFCEVIADPCGIAVIPEAIGGCLGSNADHCVTR